MKTSKKRKVKSREDKTRQCDVQALRSSGLVSGTLDRYRKSSSLVEDICMRSALELEIRTIYVGLRTHRSISRIPTHKFAPRGGGGLLNSTSKP